MYREEPTFIKINTFTKGMQQPQSENLNKAIFIEYADTNRVFRKKNYYSYTLELIALAILQFPNPLPH